MNKCPEQSNLQQRIEVLKYSIKTTTTLGSKIALEQRLERLMGKPEDTNLN